jgi:hypothetical protein
MLIAAGDSIVFGSEMPDEYLTPSNLTFPALYAKRLNLEYKCLAQPGVSNSAIARIVISYLEKNTADVVLVCWTFPNRQEFRIDNEWKTLNGWIHNPDGDYTKEVVEFSKTYFKLAHSDYYEKYAMLKEILLLQNYLKVKNQRYVFTANSKIDFSDCEHASAVDSSQWIWFNGEGFWDWVNRQKFPKGPEGHPLEQAHEEASKFLPG